jgi:hypothetical protein
MTSSTGGRDQEAGSSDSIDSQVPAEIHRAMGSAGVRLNEAHSHLVALRTTIPENRPDAAEVTEAELDALVHELEKSREQLDTALNIATEAAEEIRGDGSADEDDSGELEVRGEMLWNTIRMNKLNH